MVLVSVYLFFWSNITVGGTVRCMALFELSDLVCVFIKEMAFLQTLCYNVVVGVIHLDKSLVQY